MGVAGPAEPFSTLLFAVRYAALRGKPASAVSLMLSTIVQCGMIGAATSSSASAVLLMASGWLLRPAAGSCWCRAAGTCAYAGESGAYGDGGWSRSCNGVKT